ncbi:hypothetical protein GCM10022410_05240 [Amphibacillus indicireducens]|uniref:Uncharacterized protein n=1 Tax=Amphibacillus indicireducens TaxID=1076330 RepID=A0ABP7V7B9_9BACI
MADVTQAIYNEIKKDLPLIEEGLKRKNGSQKLWRKLRSKYAVLIPELEGKVKVSGKISAGGSEFDYRPELEQLKEVILAYLIINPINKQSNDNIANKSEVLLHDDIRYSKDEVLLKKIEESKIYIRASDSDKKQIALEKIWDCFERLKTLYGDKKKQSLNELLNNVSHNSNELYSRLNQEFNELTKIGNEFQIRHFETNTKQIPSDHFREYLYFRVLSLISYCLNEINE